jgi:hypothetical protein
MEGIEELLASVREGRLTIQKAAEALRKGYLPGGPRGRLDFRRAERTGIPEVILAEGKSLFDLRQIVESLRLASIGAIISRLSEEQLQWMILTARPEEEVDPTARLAILKGNRPVELLRGKVAALLTAGTADSRVAREVEGVLKALGATVVSAYDVGVAGLHRLTPALEEAERGGADIYIVCAGREGALPTVVAGLVDRPVIAVPTSSGYGRGGRGEAALTSMLQSCAPLAVVNIDAGVPAALVAAQFLRHLPNRARPTPADRALAKGRRGHAH